jgi:hypothetical protein
MTFPVSLATIPFCGACGYDHEVRNVNDDQTCDSCGATVSFTGFSTTATAGLPGSFDAGLPSDFAGLVTTNIIASPLTAWNTDEAVELADASDAYWDGTDWQVGTSP